MGRCLDHFFGLTTCLALVALPGTGQAAACKMALVLALDISSSVNQREYDIQLQGLAQAFRTPEVIEAILTPPGTAIATIVYEWSGYRAPRKIPASFPDRVESV